MKLFRQTRRQAEMEMLVARLTGRASELLCYQQVRNMPRARGNSWQGIHEVRLDAIVGSVERYSDFTRS